MGARSTVALCAGIAMAALSAFKLAAQSASAAPAFEVASIKPHQGPLSRIMQLRVSGSLVTMEAYSILLLIREAYHLTGNYQVSLAAVPRQEADIREVMYDIVARTPGDNALPRDEIRKMLQILLADRFKLTIHRETREMPVYALTAGKNGPKLRRSGGGNACSMHQKVASDGRNYEYAFSGCPVEQLARELEQLGIDRPVVDRTGIAGSYDFTLAVTPEFMVHGASEFDITTSAALAELGLKLESQKAPIAIIVVDQVDRPTEN